MQHLEVSGAVWPLYGSLGVKGLNDCRSMRISGVSASDLRELHSIIIVFIFMNLPVKCNSVYVPFVGFNLAVSRHFIVCNYWPTSKMSYVYDWSSFKILLPWPRCFINYRVLTESERKFLSRPSSCYFAFYRNISSTKVARYLNVCYYKSDVWLTVHRNSVWIRKTN